MCTQAGREYGLASSTDDGEAEPAQLSPLNSGDDQNLEHEEDHGVTKDDEEHAEDDSAVGREIGHKDGPNESD